MEPFSKRHGRVLDDFLPNGPAVNYSLVLSPSSLIHVVRDDSVTVDFQ